MRIKRFFEMQEERYDYDRILNYLHKRYGLGNGVLTIVDEFEDNSEYFKNPQTEDDYVDQFRIFITDKQLNRLRGTMNRSHSLNLGKWKIGQQVDKPTSIYNKLY